MIKFLLRAFTRAATAIPFLMPAVIRMSMAYLRFSYRKVFRETDPVTRADMLKRLTLLRQKLHPPDENYIVEIKLDEDIRLSVNICQQYCGDMYYGVRFEQDEMALVQEFVGAGDIFFDVGANIGVYTLLASRLVGGSGHVHAFEPLANARALLQRNMELNSAVNITINPFAVGDRTGEADLFVNVQGALTGLGRTNRGEVLEIHKVPILTLDHYAAQKEIRSIDFLKIDVEGFEGHALRGAAGLLSSSPDLIVMCELAEKNFKPLGFSVSEVINWARGLDFEIWMICDYRQGLQFVPAGSYEFPFQNFIFIRRASQKYNLMNRLERAG